MNINFTIHDLDQARAGARGLGETSHARAQSLLTSVQQTKTLAQSVVDQSRNSSAADQSDLRLLRSHVSTLRNDRRHARRQSLTWRLRILSARVTHALLGAVRTVEQFLRTCACAVRRGCPWNRRKGQSQ